jgi:hypothetical protein
MTSPINGSSLLTIHLDGVALIRWFKAFDKNVFL